MTDPKPKPTYEITERRVEYWRYRTTDPRARDIGPWSTIEEVEDLDNCEADGPFHDESEIESVKELIEGEQPD